MNFVEKNSLYRKSITIWLLTLTLIVLFLIIIGGLTRLTESGLSMVDWRPLMGIIPPLNESSWISVFEQYKLSPEFIILNSSMSLNEFKYIFWWEWFHRILARLLGFVFIIPFIFFLFKKSISKKLIYSLVFLFFFGLLQAIVGWWMVKSGLQDDPYVSSYRLTFHLTNALIIFTMLFWISLSAIYGNNKNNFTPSFLKNLFHISLILVFITIISGAFMAGSDAGKSYNTYPLMDEKFIPDEYYISEYGWLNSFENIVAINFNHRWLATFTFLFIIGVVIYSFFEKKIKINNFTLFLVLFFITLQFLLGILTLIYGVPILLASLHQTNSIFLLASLMFAYHKLIYI